MGSPRRMTEKPETIFWSIAKSYIYRLHVEPRVQLYVPKEETFPIPLRYMDDVVGHSTCDPGRVAREPYRRLVETWMRSEPCRSHGLNHAVHNLD